MIEKHHDVLVYAAVFRDGIIKIDIDGVIFQVYQVTAEQGALYFYPVIIRDHLHIVFEVIVDHQQGEIHPYTPENIHIARHLYRSFQ
ncbi:hypothetical protein FQZ97_1237330 [compost metagenome]